MKKLHKQVQKMICGKVLEKQIRSQKLILNLVFPATTATLIENYGQSATNFSSSVFIIAVENYVLPDIR